MKTVFKIFFILYFAASGVLAVAQEPGSAPASAQPGEPPLVSADVTVKSKKIEFARPFETEVELSAPAVLNREKSASPDFEIIAQRRDPDNILKTAFTILPFNLGQLTFPPLVFTDETGAEIKTEPFAIEVAPAKTKIKSQGLVDIRPPYRPFNYLFVFCLAVLFSVLAAAALFIYKKIKTPRTPPLLPANPIAADGRPYHIVALEQIDNLVNEGLWEAGQFNLFYVRLTDIFRNYIEARFKIPAHRYTNRELQRSLKNSGDFKGDLKQVADFAQAADYVKFARAFRNERERQRDIHNLKLIIMDTRQADLQLPGQNAAPGPQGSQPPQERKE
jgi:hypothetical protein